MWDHQTLEGFEQELSALIRARYPLIYINTYEESRAVEVLSNLSKGRSSTLYLWSRTKGIRTNTRAISDISDPMQALRWYEDLNEKSILVLKDFHPYLKEPGVVRKLRDLGQSFKSAPKTLILLSPLLTVPPELSKEVSVLELPLPKRDEIVKLIEKAMSVVPQAESTPDSLGEIADASTGLTYDEIENVLAKSLVARGTLDKWVVQEEKRQTVKRSGILEFVDTKVSAPAGIGGMDQLKSWLVSRRVGLGQQARDLGLPMPKGILLVGIPGCGKSLTAMTVGKEWGLPLLRLDMGRIFSGLVGSSENNMRAAIQTCEAVAPCVLWVDEIEKGLSGTQSSGSSDGGTTSRVFGTLLTWMQEKKSSVFVVATANDISQLPPEFLRKGRFDEIFFVDLPDALEREEIFKIQLGRYRWEVKDLALERLVEATEGFSGAEIEQIIVAARYLALSENASFGQAHLESTIEQTVPLSKTMGERIDFLRKWAVNRARPASRPRPKGWGGSNDNHSSFQTRSLEMTEKTGDA